MFYSSSIHVVVSATAETMDIHMRSPMHLSLVVLSLIMGSFGFSDPDHCPSTVVQCIECDTRNGEDFCADPFVKVKQGVSQFAKPCKGGYCVKWVRNYLGMTHYKRTCSKKMQMNLERNLVCIRETGSPIGKLCFCKKDECNSSRQRVTTSFTVTFLSTVMVGLSILGM